jgi:hypothetical protein
MFIRLYSSGRIEPASTIASTGSFVRSIRPSPPVLPVSSVVTATTISSPPGRSSRAR